MYQIAARVRTVTPRNCRACARSTEGHAVLWMLARAILAAGRAA